MKKYLIAGGAALVAFALLASAASLVVNGGVLQAGVDNDLTCTEAADITYETSNDGVGHYIEAIIIETDAACEGSYAVVNGMTGSTGANQIISAISQPIDADGYVRVNVANLDNNARPAAAALDRVQVLIKDRLVDRDTNPECPGFLWTAAGGFYPDGYEFPYTDCLP